MKPEAVARRAEGIRLREEGWSCTEVGRRLGVSRSTVALWAPGRRAGTDEVTVRSIQVVVDGLLAGNSHEVIARASGYTPTYVADLAILVRWRWAAEMATRSPIEVGPRDIAAFRRRRL